jgi:hypothetical protein
MDDSVAREKVGCLLRDRLHSQYRSSSKAKMAKRRALKAFASSSDDAAVNEDDLDLLGGDSISIKHAQTDNADYFAAWACGAGAAGGSSCNNNNNMEQESMFPSSKKFSMDLFGKSSSAMMMARRKTGGADALSNSVDNSGGGSIMVMGGNGLLPTSSQGGNNTDNNSLNPANNIASLVDQAFGILGRRQNPAASRSFQPLPMDFNSVHSDRPVNFRGDLPTLEVFAGLRNTRQQQQQHRHQDDFNSFMGEDLLMNSMNAGASDFALAPLDDDIFDM